MNKPYITCYMATSVDGRIDCPMTEKLPGVEEYYPMLNSFNFDATLSGRVTAQLEMAESGTFNSKTSTKITEEVFLNKTCGKKPYDVIVDTNGILLWKNSSEYENDLIIITSQNASREYIKYLEEKGISYIVAGENQIDLFRAVEVLASEFGVNSLGIVGGSAINTAFLDANLTDEIIILIGAGIDGRASFPTVFSRENDDENTFRPLKLVDVKTFNSGSVLIRYKTR